MLKIMIVGDSITHGSSGDWTWRYRLWNHLKSHEARVDFVGPRRDLDHIATAASGDGDETYADSDFDLDHLARWGRPYTAVIEEIDDHVVEHDPDIVLTLLGINDLVWYGQTPFQLEQSVRIYIAQARRIRADVGMVFGRVLPTARAAEDAAFAAAVAEYNARLTQTAADLTLATSPIAVAGTDAEFDAGAHTWDGTHPNPDGELRIAAAFADTLASDFSLAAPYPRPFPKVAAIAKPTPV